MKNKKWIKDILGYFLGAFIYSSAVTMFISGNEISPGGLTGISTAISFLTGLPSGLLLLVLNIPILVLGFIKFGGIFIFKTAVATVILSFSLTFTDLVLPVFQIDRILASVFGGILMGLGLSIIMLRGATSGGVDIVAKLINRKFRHFTVGKLILILDAVVIAIAVFAYKNIESALCSVISLYASSRIMDMMLYGGDKGKIIYIITDKSNEICRSVSENLKRGVTVIKAFGGYTGKEHSLLMCVVRIYEVSAVYDLIEEADSNAFITVIDAGEIIGEGFKKFG